MPCKGLAQQLAWACAFISACAAQVAVAAVSAKSEADSLVRWVYPERDKPPLIAQAPNSAGFFDALFQRVAQQAGLALAVDRVPKARAWQQLQQGTSDFYPGASFSLERSRHVVWLDTGLVTREVCLLRPGLRLTQPLAQSAPLTLAVEPGSSKIEQYPQHDAQHFGSRLTVERALELLSRARVDVVLMDIEPLTVFSAGPGQQRMRQLGVTVDENCAGPWLPMWLAWSRSALPQKPKHRPIPVLTQPRDQSTALPKGSEAARFHAALVHLRETGELNRLASRYGLHTQPRPPAAPAP